METHWLSLGRIGVLSSGLHPAVGLLVVAVSGFAAAVTGELDSGASVSGAIARPLL